MKKKYGKKLKREKRKQDKRDKAVEDGLRRALGLKPKK